MALQTGAALLSLLLQFLQKALKMIEAVAAPVALGNFFELLLLLCVMSISRQPSPLPHFFNSFVSLVSFSLVL